LWPSGVFYSYLLHFSRFGTLWQEKSGNLAVNSGRYLSKRCAVARVSATVPTYISEIEKNSLWPCLPGLPDIMHIWIPKCANWGTF
jgi:hypothetical protein